LQSEAKIKRSEAKIKGSEAKIKRSEAKKKRSEAKKKTKLKQLKILDSPPLDSQLPQLCSKSYILFKMN